ncbi:ABC transporter ATP-binding protein [Cohnella lubricantis]|uniref:ABC transporter ATP-binding protein n=1 Tax=Cohnella lubricantis TaxID=2163172 RepID=A0A841TC92_9BACL|nr:ABC transporter ATP-binding protein [Cohnella lubricantis]MBB6676617.1 ABC transporter ATP-binding protein [Cohnella lubricantis]MBP2117372.1 ATP-binding cassette subfamily B protein [Cohnella lubricantis]
MAQQPNPNAGLTAGASAASGSSSAGAGAGTGAGAAVGAGAASSASGASAREGLAASGSAGSAGASPPEVHVGHGRPPVRGRGGPVQKPKNMRGTLRRLWEFVGKERRWLAIVFLFVLVDSALTLAGPYLIGTSVDAAADSSGVDFRLLTIALIALAAAYIGDAVLTWLQGWLMAGVSQRIVRSLRESLFAKLHKLPLAYFDTRRHGEIMSRLSNDIDNVSMTVSQTTSQLMTGAIAIVGSLVMMLVLSPLLTLASLITVPLVYLLARTITKRTSVLFKQQQAQLGMLNGQIEETISGVEAVKSFNRERQVVASFEETNRKLRDIGIRAQIWSGFLMPLLSVINNIGFAAVAIVGGTLAVKGIITVGVIASFISYSRQFVRPLNDLANIYNMLQSGIAGAERVFELLDEKEEPVDEPGAVTLQSPKGEVVFDHVQFGYRADTPIVRGMSFRAEAGTNVALVGPTGAGKTTIVNLLTRFYDVTGGSVRIDGKDVREYTRDSLRVFGIVLQDTYLFSGTIRDNIKYGKPDATDEEVREAAMTANADGFIRLLPKQYDTELTENGGNLSQGQRQLLAIASVVLAKPSILILDEATSSIDTRTERHIQDALLHIMKGRTAFIIAHRLNTIRDADTIMVIDKGSIVESGSHDELIGRQGVYYRMYYNQFKNVVDGA